MRELPENFEDYTEAKKKGFLVMKALKEAGGKVVGTFCTFTPTELPVAAGCVTVGLCGLNNEPIADAEKVLPKNLCPLIKASYGYAYTDTCPYFYFSDMILGETTCDGKKKMYELLDKIKHTHVMQLPPGRFGKGALDFWKEEMYTLKDVLEKKFNTEITDDKLREAIKLKNRERIAMLKFFELGKLKPTPLSGYELSTVMDSISFIFDNEERIKTLEERTKELTELYENEFKGKPSRKRILITGCPTGGVREKVIKTIEDLGADVVSYETCSGVREKMDLVDETIDPYTALAEKYLRVSCSVMSPNPGRFESLSYLIDEYQVDGVVEVVLQACHTFSVESYNVKEHVTKVENKPYICIETDYSTSDSGQINTRLTAFLELLS